MRLDKYLKVARVFKRRTVAKEIALHDRAVVNGRVAKPSTEIKIGDIITVRYGNREFTIKVTSLLQQASKEAAAGMFDVLNEVILEEGN
ncbi:MAG: RNA-binding S4 domain-containing protein [Candidatus Izemoplasmatales bacterium]|nr:RNA-binding S4 domain-containing protein [Candidatus Izemoplasmatales bacterium]